MAPVTFTRGQALSAFGLPEALPEHGGKFSWKERSDTEISETEERETVIYIYIYIWRRPRFLPTFLAFWKAKTAYLAILRQKGKRKGTKRTTKLVVLFWSKSALFPQFKANICLICRQKTRPWPHIYIYIYTDESDKGTHFDKWRVKQRDARRLNNRTQHVEKIALPHWYMVLAAKNGPQITG